MSKIVANRSTGRYDRLRCELCKRVNVTTEVRFSLIMRLSVVNTVAAEDNLAS